MESRKQTAMHRGRAREKSEDIGISELFLAVLFGLAVMAAVAIVLLLVGAGIAYSAEDPASLAKPIALIALYVSIFFGGLAAAKRAAENKLLGGILFTALVFALVFILKLIMTGDGEGISGSTYYLLGALGASAAGVLASSYSPQKKPMSRKKRAEKFKRK